VTIPWPVSLRTLRSGTFWSLVTSVLGHGSVCKILTGGCSGISRVRVRLGVKVRFRDGCREGRRRDVRKLLDLLSAMPPRSAIPAVAEVLFS